MEQSNIRHNVDVYTAYSKQVTRISAGLKFIALISSAWVFDFEHQRVHPRPSQDWPQRQTACFCVRISQGSANPSQNWDNTLWRILPRWKCSNWRCPGCDMFGLKINELPSCIAKDIFKALFVDDLAICFRGRSLDTIERHLQQAVNAIEEWATRNGFRFAAHKCKVIHLTAPRSRAQRPPIVRIGNTLLPVEESTKFLGLWWDSHLSFKKHISVLKTQCKEALNLIRVVAHLKWGGDRDTLLMLYRAIVRSKFDYGCIVYGTASNTNLRQLDSVHNSGLRLALGAFCTSPVSSLYTEANEAPFEERRLKLSMHYYVKTRACIDSPAHHALHEFDRTTRDLYAPRPNGRGGMTRPPAPPIGLHDLCRDQCRIGLPPEDTQLSTRNALLWSQETRPHWRSK